ncbi:MAG TPA: hypothetical protein VFE36_13255 [Candidatus Baltobacteraceae bacterium]|jgi:hypothetical protein|nr:hypothetical protein [Candidatus Baltobacteraceae bacterium]
MKNVIVALTLALSLIPVSAMAQTSPSGVRSITPAQRQAMFQQFQAFHQREEQLHQQFRSQVLGTLSGEQRTSVANLIGQLAISSNPDFNSAAAQLDSVLSQGQKQQILNAHNTFRAQSKSLHEQMMRQMRNEMPGGPSMGEHSGAKGMMQHTQMQPDAGMILLHVLGGGFGGDHHMMGGPPHR